MYAFYGDYSSDSRGVVLDKIEVFKRGTNE